MRPKWAAPFRTQTYEAHWHPTWPIRPVAVPGRRAPDPVPPAERTPARPAGRGSSREAPGQSQPGADPGNHWAPQLRPATSHGACQACHGRRLPTVDSADLERVVPGSAAASAATGAGGVHGCRPLCRRRTGAKRDSAPLGSRARPTRSGTGGALDGRRGHRSRRSSIENALWSDRAGAVPAPFVSRQGPPCEDT
jgi:hypothetical protein